MTCRHEADLTAYLDNELDAVQREGMADHVKTCAACASTLTLLQGALTRLEEMPQWEPSPNLRRAVLTRIGEEPLGAWSSLKQKWWMPRLFVPALAGATALGVVLLVTQQTGSAVREMNEQEGIELAANLEVVRDMEVLGVEHPEDLDVVADLEQLEATP